MADVDDKRDHCTLAQSLPKLRRTSLWALPGKPAKSANRYKHVRRETPVLRRDRDDVSPQTDVQPKENIANVLQTRLSEHRRSTLEIGLQVR